MSRARRATLQNDQIYYLPTPSFDTRSLQLFDKDDSPPTYSSLIFPDQVPFNTPTKADITPKSSSERPPSYRSIYVIKPAPSTVYNKPNVNL